MLKPSWLSARPEKEGHAGKRRVGRFLSSVMAVPVLIFPARQAARMGLARKSDRCRLHVPSSRPAAHTSWLSSGATRPAIFIQTHRRLDLAVLAQSTMLAFPHVAPVFLYPMCGRPSRILLSTSELLPQAVGFRTTMSKKIQ